MGNERHDQLAEAEVGERVYGDGKDVDGEKDEGEQRDVSVELVRDHARPMLGAQAVAQDQTDDDGQR